MKKTTLEAAIKDLTSLESHIDDLQDNDDNFKNFEKNINDLWAKYSALEDLKNNHFDGKSLEDGFSKLISDAKKLEKQARIGFQLDSIHENNLNYINSSYFYH